MAMTNVKVQMPYKVPKSKVYDLEERTAQLGEEIISFAKLLPHIAVVVPLISQIVRSGASVGANYMEADTAVIKKDFKFKISICRKEAKEACHWLRMITQAVPEHREGAQRLKQKSWELVLIFSSILKC